jgi:hypothetical protein
MLIQQSVYQPFTKSIYTDGTQIIRHVYCSITPRDTTFTPQ